jgi:hypothetical protein
MPLVKKNFRMLQVLTFNMNSHEAKCGKSWKGEKKFIEEGVTRLDLLGG